jgi:hypothetical protein
LLERLLLRGCGLLLRLFLLGRRRGLLQVRLLLLLLLLLLQLALLLLFLRQRRLGLGLSLSDNERARRVPGERSCRSQEDCDWQQSRQQFSIGGHDFLFLGRVFLAKVLEAATASTVSVHLGHPVSDLH